MGSADKSRWKGNECPLLEALQKHCQADFCSFHIPAHKGGSAFPPYLKGRWGEKVLKWDLTELPGLDDLHAPQGAIASAQEAAARIWGAAQTFFLVNGSTVGIEAMLWAAAGEGEKVLLSRQAHRSALGGMILSGAWPVYLAVEIEPEFQIPLGSFREEIQRKVAASKTLAAAFVVYPNAYGIADNLQEVINCCRGKKIPVLVDEAWGAHFIFSPRFPPPALRLGAEAAVQSWHKMLGSLTQTAVLHCQGEDVAEEEIRKRLLVLQTTSPSYLLLASLDAARAWMEKEGQRLWEQALELAEKARRRINQLPGLRCLDERVLQHPAVSGWDPMRLVVRVSDLGLSGFEAADFLARECQLQLEMADAFNVVAVVSAGDTEASVESLLQGFKALSQRFAGPTREKSGRRKTLAPALKKWPLAEVVMSPRQAFLAAAKSVTLQEARGRIAAELVCPYPPGIPLLAPGEKIVAEVLDLMAELAAAGARWQGAADPSLRTLRVVKEE